MRRRDFMGIGISAGLCAGCEVVGTGGGDLDDVVFVPAHGEGRAAAISSALAQGDVLLESKTYLLEGPIVVRHDDRRIFSMDGQAVLKANFFPDASRADDPMNAVLLFAGAPLPDVLDTVLAAHAPADSQAIYLRGIGALVPGDHIVISGHNDPAFEVSTLSSGERITLTEVVQVKEIEAVGEDFVARLTWPTMQNHTITNGSIGAQCSVRAVDAVAGLQLENLTFEAAGGTVAVGASLAYALRCELKNCHFRGFSRAEVNAALGSRDLRFNDHQSFGESNSMLYLDSAFAVSVENPWRWAGAERFHALGKPRGLITWTQRCRAHTIDNPVLARGCIGFQATGGMDLTITGGYVTDLDIREAMARDELLGPICGVGMDLCRTVVDDNETGIGLTCKGTQFTNCRQKDNEQAALWLHDFFSLEIDVLVENLGVPPGSSIDDQSYIMHGVRFQDAGGRFQGTIRGVDYAFRYNSSQGWLFDNVRVDLAGHGNPQPLIAAEFNQSADEQLQFGELYLRGFVIFGSNFDDKGARGIHIDDFSYDGTRYTDVICAKNTSGGTRYQGEVVVLDPESPVGGLRLKVPSGSPLELAAVVITPAGHGQYCLICPLPAGKAGVKVSAPVNVGDRLETVRNEVHLVPNNESENAVAVVHEAKASNLGLAIVGPV